MHRNSFGRFYLSKICLCASSVLIFWPCAQSSGVEGAAVSIAGRNIVVGLIRIADRAPVSPPSAPLKVMTESIQAQPGLSISDVLVKYGIYPDSGAYSVLYDLNPGISKLDAVPDGTRLTIPAPLLGPEWKTALADGSQLVTFSVDEDLYKKLLGNIASLRTEQPKFQAADGRRFADAAKSGTTKKLVSEIIGWCTSISKAVGRRSAPPTSRDTLVALVNETAALEDLLQHATAKAGGITIDDEHQIGAIHRDFEEEIQRYGDVLSGGIPVGEDANRCILIATIDGGDPGLAKRLRVYFTLDGEFHQPPPPPLGVTPFPNLGSGKSDPVRPKRYEVWAAPDGHPEQMATEALLITILPNQQESSFHLLLRSGH